MTATLANGGVHAKRRALDFYPTPPDVTLALLRFMQWAPTNVWEPACGDGAMARVIAADGHRVYASDIADSGYGVPHSDFLLSAPPEGVGMIITNPPFDKAAEFIHKAVGEAPVVAMLLKSQYWHAKKRKPLFDSKPPAWVLPLTWRPDFMAGERGGAPTMDVLWTVWCAGDTLTKYTPLARPCVAQAPNVNPFL